MLGIGLAVGGQFGDFTYTILGDNTIEITDCPTFVSGDVVIPDTINETNVTSVGDWSFSSCDRLTNLTIPRSVTNIGNGAFYNCHGLENFTIPNGVTTIGVEAFAYCHGLTSLKMASSVTSIGAGAFSDCYGLTVLRMPRSVTNIGDYAFSYCDRLKAVIFDGNAPPMYSGMFNSSDLAKIYYRSDASGFGSTFADRPTALIPQFVDMTFSASSMVMNTLGTDGEVYVLQLSSNLTSGTWTSLETNTVSGGGVEFNLSTLGDGKFYRVVIEL